MLHESGIHELADKVDNQAIEKVLPAIIDLGQQCAPTEHWSQPASNPDWNGRPSS